MVKNVKGYIFNKYGINMVLQMFGLEINSWLKSWKWIW